MSLFKECKALYLRHHLQGGVRKTGDTAGRLVHRQWPHSGNDPANNVCESHRCEHNLRLQSPNLPDDAVMTGHNVLKTGSQINLNRPQSPRNTAIELRIFVLLLEEANVQCKGAHLTLESLQV